MAIYMDQRRVAILKEQFRDLISRASELAVSEKRRSDLNRVSYTPSKKLKTSFLIMNRFVLILTGS